LYEQISFTSFPLFVEMIASRKKLNKRPTPRNGKLVRKQPLWILPVYQVELVVTRPSNEERLFLFHLVYDTYHLSASYLLQSLSIWIRIKHIFPREYFEFGILCCLNITVHFLGPQDVCSVVKIFTACETQKRVDLLKHAQNLHTFMLGYSPAPHLELWKVAKNIQWFIVLKQLKGRIQ
jgi:hypothetical protein